MLPAESQQILFRPARTEVELKELLRLRYRVFDKDDVRAFLTPNPHEIDLDSYDVNSHHVGLFTGDNPIGYTRLITLQRGPQADLVESVMKRYALAPSPQITTSPLPVFGYAPDMEQTRNWIMRRASEGHNIVEASRLSLASSVRGRRTVLFMGRALVSYWLASGFDTAVIACRVEHVTHWESFGFQTAPGTRQFEISGIPARALALTTDTLAQRVQSTVFAMAREFEQSGSIVCADCVTGRAQPSARKSLRASFDTPQRVVAV